jgi:hypothetical protein
MEQHALYGVAMLACHGMIGVITVKVLYAPRRVFVKHFTL